MKQVPFILVIEQPDFSRNFHTSKNHTDRGGGNSFVPHFRPLTASTASVLSQRNSNKHRLTKTENPQKTVKNTSSLISTNVKISAANNLSVITNKDWSLEQRNRKETVKNEQIGFEPIVKSRNVVENFNNKIAPKKHADSNGNNELKSNYDYHRSRVSKFQKSQNLASTKTELKPFSQSVKTEITANVTTKTMKFATSSFPKNYNCPSKTNENNADKNTGNVKIRDKLKSANKKEKLEKRVEKIDINEPDFSHIVVGRKFGEKCFEDAEILYQNQNIEFVKLECLKSSTNFLTLKTVNSQLSKFSTCKIRPNSAHLDNLSVVVDKKNNAKIFNKCLLVSPIVQKPRPKTARILVSINEDFIEEAEGEEDLKGSKLPLVFDKLVPLVMRI
jgi:hypothetical protein